MSARLAAGFGLLTLLVLIAVGAGEMLASSTASTSHRAAMFLTATRELKQFQLDGESVAVSENSIGFDYNSRSDPSDDIDHLALNAAAFERDAHQVQRLPLSAAQRAILSNAQRVFTVYIAHSEQANRDFHRGTRASIKAANNLINGLAYVGVTDGLNRLAVGFGQRVDKEVADSAAWARQARTMVAVVGLLAVLCAALASLLITRSIVAPLRRTVDVLDAVAAGDLTRSLNVNSRDEISQMGRALNRTVERLRGAMDELTVLARTDPLTGLANRGAYDSALRGALAEVRDGCCSVLFLDLDNFKMINDTLGHAGGDAVLVEVANRLTQACRAGDLCARLGGDEFALLLPQTDRDVAQSIAERIRAALRTPVTVGATGLVLGVSIGVTVETINSDVEQVLSHADLAMYSAKTGGKGQIRVYDAHPLRAESLDDQRLSRQS